MRRRRTALPKARADREWLTTGPVGNRPFPVRKGVFPVRCALPSLRFRRLSGWQSHHRPELFCAAGEGTIAALRGGVMKVLRNMYPLLLVLSATSVCLAQLIP